MKTFRTLLPAVLLFVLAACGGSDGTGDESGAMQGAPPAAADEQPAQPSLEDGVQVVHVEAGAAGYEPSAIELKPGVPARLVFTRTVESECMEQVQIPAFGVERTDLPLDEPVEIEFTPEEGGSFTFVCGMDMVTGTIVVRS